MSDFQSMLDGSYYWTHWGDFNPDDRDSRPEVIGGGFPFQPPPDSLSVDSARSAFGIAQGKPKASLDGAFKTIKGETLDGSSGERPSRPSLLSLLFDDSEIPF